ncbi:hypothetical protein VTI74DRAFT_1902 [Chaetomium olivicolor]
MGRPQCQLDKRIKGQAAALVVENKRKRGLSARECKEFHRDSLGLAGWNSVSQTSGETEGSGSVGLVRLKLQRQKRKLCAWEIRSLWHAIPGAYSINFVAFSRACLVTEADVQLCCTRVSSVRLGGKPLGKSGRMFLTWALFQAFSLPMGLVNFTRLLWSCHSTQMR